METELDKQVAPTIPPLDPKELDFFVERLAQILLMQIEHENKNEHEKETRRIPKAV